MVSADPKKIHDIVQQIFMGNGVPEADADYVAKTLIEANLTGRSSHGVLRTGAYIERIQKGGANTTPDIKVVNETPVSAVIDGDNALGSLIAKKASEICREKALQTGMAVVVARNCNHYGAAAYWTELIGQDDMITFSCCNTGTLVAPPGAAKAALGTNPVCVYVPSKTYGPLCLDIATSLVAQGKMLDYRKKGLPLPDGWAVDKNGVPTNDANEAEYLTPMAGHKGYGISVLVDILSGVLAGGHAFGDKVNDLYRDIEKPNLVSYCFIAINLNMFRPAEEFRQEIDEYIDYLHGLPTAPGARIYFPGEIEIINKAKAEEEGLQLPEALIDELKQLATAAGVADVDSYFA